MKKYFGIIGLLMLSLSLQGQQVSRVSNYIYNQLYFNPAASGMYDQQLNVSVLNKFQWTGIEGAPMLSLLWIDYKTNQKGLSFGGVVERYKFGVSRRMGLSFNPTYSVLIGYKLRLAMSLRFGLEQMLFDPNSLQNVFDDGDPLLGSNAFNESFFKIGGGFQLRSSRFHLGVASVDLFMNDKYFRYNPDSSGFFNKPRNYVANVDYKISLNDSYSLIPSAILYTYKRNKMVAGAGLILEIKDYFWAGSNFYSNKMATFSIGTHISSRLRFAYSYERAFSKDLPEHLSSHEVNLLFKMDRLFKKNKN